MTDKQILRKAIEKAVKNGWNIDPNAEYILNKAPNELEHWIFHHDFAKAFWGIEDVDSYGNTFDEYEEEVKKGMHYPIDYEWSSRDMRWGYHIKHMALSENRIKYLKEFL